MVIQRGVWRYRFFNLSFHIAIGAHSTQSMASAYDQGRSWPDRVDPKQSTLELK